MTSIRASDWEEPERAGCGNQARRWHSSLATSYWLEASLQVQPHCRGHICTKKQGPLGGIRLPTAADPWSPVTQASPTSAAHSLLSGPPDPVCAQPQRTPESLVVSISPGAPQAAGGPAALTRQICPKPRAVVLRAQPGRWQVLPVDCGRWGPEEGGPEPPGCSQGHGRSRLGSACSPSGCAPRGAQLCPAPSLPLGD